jgi:hypothetical protein
VKCDVKNRTAQRHHKKQDGYAILLVLFFVTLLLLMTISVAPNILTQGRRQKEIEMIWRGKQYSRAVKLYYRKTGKFPTSMDNLIKPTVGNIRFIRQAYKDPVNTKDGEWRLIYVGPSGQLIGSLKAPQTLQLSGVAGVAGTPGTPAAQVGAQSSGQGIGQAFGQTFGNPGAASSSAGANTMGQLGGAASSSLSTTASPSNTPPATGTGTGADTTSTDPSANPSDAANEALLASDPTTVLGGNIIGVGSKVNQRSILVYDKAKNYKQFEFIWDPAKDAITVGGAPGTQIGTPTGQPGQFGTFGSPANPMSGPTSNPSSNPNSPGAPPVEPPPSSPETTPPQQ